MFKRWAASAFVALLCSQLAAPAAALPQIQVKPAAHNWQPTPVAARSKRKKMSPKLENIRKRLIARKAVSTGDLRRLADGGDSLAAYAFAKQLSARNNIAIASDTLHYYTQAALSGRSYAVRPMLKLLGTAGAAFKPAHLKQAERALNSLAARGNSVAIQGLIELYSSDKPFGKKPSQIAKLLDARIAGGDGDAAYRLAVSIISAPERTPETTQDAIRYLEIAARSGSLGVKTSAANILVQIKAENLTTSSGGDL